jgi:radical SAM superfamily enzyme YgiQ (UPF0313 family)
MPMKVLLVFPPQWTPFRPYLSLPSLAAYLRQQGITVVQKDFNLEAYDLMLSEGYLRRIGERLKSQFAAQELKDNLAPGIEQKFYNDLFMAKSLAPALADRVEAAKIVYRDSRDFYDPEKLAAATHTISQALSVVGQAHFPTTMGLSSFNMPSFTGSYLSLKAATQNRLENPYLELYEEHLLPFIRAEKPNVIGITISGESQLIPALTLSRLLKSPGIRAHITVGGYVVSMLADVLVKYPELYELFFDSAIINDGEKPMLELVRHLEHGDSLCGVPNLIFRDGNEIRINTKEPPENINSLPAPNFEGLPLDKYFSPEPVLPLLSSRGCYWSKCTFCTHSLAYGLTCQVREPVKVVDDIELLSSKYGATHIAFSDEGTSPASISKISDEIQKRGLKVRLSTSIRPEKQFTPELCRKMAAAGFREVYIGIESSCERVLGRINKGTTGAVNEEILKNIHDAGIWDHVYIMFGFPGETMEEAQQTFRFLEKHKNIIRSLGISNFSVGRNSMVMHHPEDFGVTLTETGDEFDFKLYFNYKVAEGLTQIQGWDLTEECFAKVAVQLEGDVLLEKIGHHYDKGCILPQYLSHYEATDPFLRSIVKEKHPSVKHKSVTVRSQPVLKHGITVERLKFNLRQIRQNIADNTGSAVYPEPGLTLSDPENSKFKRISEQTEEILALCDGRRTVSQIAQKLAKQYRIPLAVIERDCLKILQPIFDEGYLTLAPETATVHSKR